MACDARTEKFDAYFDGELSIDEARACHEHLRHCADCAAEGLRTVQQRRAVQGAGLRFTPDPAFRARIQRNIAASRPSPWRRSWLPILLTTAATLLIASSLLLISQRDRRREQQLLSELVDQHVATLASANPVDVVSTDRHTVKPWFEGKIPFTFNLPELQSLPFVLAGGRVSYLSQSPGAQLIFRIRRHQISVFIFQENGLRGARDYEALRSVLSFELRTWHHNGLRYFVIGDASAQDLDKLTELIKAAG
jgi:anti-sigma factor RsiW